MHSVSQFLAKKRGEVVLQIQLCFGKSPGLEKRREQQTGDKITKHMSVVGS
jgi:hypothetical protein